MSLLQTLVSQPNPMLGQLLAILQMLPQPGTTGSTGYTGSRGTTTGTTTYPNGATAYPYQTWDFPYGGLPPNSPLLMSRRGVTLQEGPLQSLIDIARASNILPGIRELGQIGQGYRSPSAQQYAARTNPNAANYGYSYHPEGLAIDAGWWTAHPALARALAAAGWNQLPSESWHWSYGVSG